MRVAANLALDERINARIAQGADLLHLGFGESRLPVPRALMDRLLAPPTDYGPVGGRESCLVSIAGYFERRGLPSRSSSVMVAPGSKPLFLALMAARPGAIVLPAPAWLTYEPQARLLGREVVRIPVRPGSGGTPDPDALHKELAGAERSSRPISLVVVTNPDNPTGSGAGPSLVRELVEVCDRFGVLVVSDEIYRDVTFDETAPYVSAAELSPNAVVVTGLSKSLSIGGWRIGAARFSDDAQGRRLRGDVLGVASHIWSNTSAPMQAVAEHAFAEPDDLVAHRRRCTRLHGIVAREVRSRFVDSGIATAPVPVGGFYVYPDLEPLRAGLRRRGVLTSADLERFVLEEFAVAVLGGHHFGDDLQALRFRAATSLLYGRTEEERAAAVRAEQPLELPWVEQALARVDDLVEGLARLG